VGEVTAYHHQVHGPAVLLVEVAHRPAVGAQYPELKRSRPLPAVLGHPSRLQREAARRVRKPRWLRVVVATMRLNPLTLPASPWLP
jgi:hypothetical protein